MNKGFAFAVVERSVLSKLRAEELRAWKVDDLCDRFNVTAVRRRRGLIPKVGDPMDTGRSLEESGRPHSATSRLRRWSACEQTGTQRSVSAPRQDTPH
jgi:hypothetical protein